MSAVAADLDRAVDVLVSTIGSLIDAAAPGEALQAVRVLLGLDLARRGTVDRLSAIEAQALHSAYAAFSSCLPAAIRGEHGLSVAAVMRVLDAIGDVYAVEIEDSPDAWRAVFALGWLQALNQKRLGRKVNDLDAFLVAGTTVDVDDN
jgi:hypothetical protein